MDTLDITEIDRHMRILHRQVVSGLLKNMDLYDGQPRLLFYISEKAGCNQKELADYLNVSSATIAVSLKRMEKCQLIKRSPDSNDLRNNIITLTDKGTDVVNRCRDLFKSVKIKMYEGFDQEEMQNLENYYKRIIDNLEKLKNEES